MNRYDLTLTLIEQLKRRLVYLVFSSPHLEHDEEGGQQMSLWKSTTLKY